MKKLNKFSGKRYLITGGLGFIGSNLSIELVKAGAKVTILDNMLPRQGGNLFNIKEIEDKVHINFSDIRNDLSMNHLVKDKDYIFHLAGQVNHIDSIRNPLKDLSINVEGTLVLLEACKKHNTDAKIIFTGTRGQYGPTVRLPVDEEHPMNPKGVYAITNMTAEKMMQVYNDVHKIKTVCLRITNTYGPRHQMQHDEYGVLNWFIRRAIDGEVIPVFGDGGILRDFLYIDDLIECLLMVASNENSYGQTFNVGTGKPVNFIDLAKKIVEVAGSGEVRYTDFTKERKEVEPGDYYADISKIKNVIGWEPKVSLEKGLKKTINYYRKYRRYYWQKEENFKE